MIIDTHVAQVNNFKKVMINTSCPILSVKNHKMTAIKYYLASQKQNEEIYMTWARNNHQFLPLHDYARMHLNSDLSTQLNIEPQNRQTNFSMS